MEHKHHRCYMQTKSRGDADGFNAVKRGRRWGIKKGPSAYREPDVLFHYNESTGMTSGPMQVLWRWTTVSLHQYHQENLGALSGASCPHPRICAEDRWTVRRRWACPCGFRNFVLLLCRGPVYFLQIPCMYWKVCSPCWIAQTEGCCFLESTMCGIMPSQLCWETFLKLQRAHICCRCSLAHENIPSTVAPPLSLESDPSDQTCLTSDHLNTRTEGIHLIIHEGTTVFSI